MNFEYDKNNRESVLSYARRLENQTINSVCRVSEPLISSGGKGDFGNLIESCHFGLAINSRPEPDLLFDQPISDGMGGYIYGIEIKSTPIKKLIKKGNYVSKEKLFLNKINFLEIVNENFDGSSFLRKNKLLLIFFYIHDSSKSPGNLIVELVGEWLFSGVDLELIRQDWVKIKSKIQNGGAHLLSDGDTLYLAASTKGGKKSKPEAQPGSQVLAKPRALSLKSGYVNHMLATIAGANTAKKSQVYGRLIADVSVISESSFEDYVLSKFVSHYGKSIKKLSAEFKIKLNIKAKNFASRLSNLILEVSLGSRIEEFEKAGIVIKTVRLNEKNLPHQHLSFPAFYYNDFSVTSWDGSEFKSEVERKYLFIFFKEKNGEFILDKAMFWTMPSSDVRYAREIWVKAKWLITHGNVIKNPKSKNRKTYFPDIKNAVSHIRPHAKNSKDVYPLIVPDRKTGRTSYTKHSFWLNKEYIRDSIYLGG